MLEKLSTESRELLNSRSILKKQLVQVIPQDLVNYINELIIRDLCNSKYEEILKE